MDKNIKALLRICSVLGICLQIPKCCGENGLRFVNIYITLLMGIVVFNSVFGIMTSKIANEFIISWIVATGVFISQVVTHLIIMYEALAKHRQHSDFIRLLHDVDVYFKILLKTNVSISAIIAKIRCNLITMVLASKICLMVFAITMFCYADSGYFWWALLPILAMRFRFIQLIVYAEILKYYMLALNKKLNQVVSLKTEASKQLLDVDYKHLHSTEVMQNIKHIYSALYEASTLMNEFAQVSLFAASGSNFLDFTCHIYWILLTFDNFLPPYNFASSLVTILPQSFFIFRFCYICQILKDQGQRTSLLSSRLVSCNICSLTDRKYKDFVHDFCMQLMHQRIVFTGNSFFTFDLKCIFAICALIATHLIILIQFTKSDGNQNLNKTGAQIASALNT